MDSRTEERIASRELRKVLGITYYKREEEASRMRIIKDEKYEELKWRGRVLKSRVEREGT
jgi:hypothetical protein